MKKTLLTLSAFALLQIAANAQTPAGFNYQGIARTSAGAPMASKALGMRITIHDGTATGNAVYQETQTVTTNAYGLYNMTIGGGTAVTGTLGGVNWASGAKFIQVEMDAAGGTAYTDLGTSQLQSVPYAMNAATAPAPTLTLTGSTLSAGGNTVTLPAYTAGTGINIASGVISASNLGGDVTGASNANTVVKIQGTSISATAPTGGQMLQYNGTAWAPATDTSYRGTGTIGYVPMITAANTLGNSSIRQGSASSAIGIGGAPNSGGMLDVFNNSKLISLFKNTSTVGNSQAEIQVANNASSVGSTIAFGVSNVASNLANGPYGYIDYQHTGRFAIVNNNLEQLTITGGNVGINTAAPSGLLHLSQNGRIYNNAGAFGNGLVLSNGSATNATKWYLGVGSTDGYILGCYNPSNSSYSTAMFIDLDSNMGIAMDAPKSTLDVGGSFSLPIRSTSTNTTLTNKDYTVISTSAATISFTLPNAAAMKGRIYVIKRQGGGNVSVTTTTTPRNHSFCRLLRLRQQQLHYKAMESTGISSINFRRLRRLKWPNRARLADAAQGQSWTAAKPIRKAS